MRKKIFFQFICCIFLSSSLFPVGHTTYGTEYGKNGVKAYTESNHGPDGQIFLDPFFIRDIENIKNQTILDAGCGAAPWSIYAAKHGGKVFAIDIQEGMIDSAKEAIQLAQLDDKISLAKGDVACLPYEGNFFDKEISICVGCNLPPESFEKHISECNRTLKNGGLAVIGAPSSLDVVFSDGSKTETEIFLHIQAILDALPDNPSSEMISENLTKLSEVLSATFYIKNNRLSLVANEKALNEGEKIWRKLPKLVVPNNYYSKEYYLSIFRKYNFEIQKTELPHFNSEDERIAYNSCVPEHSKLGPAYVAHAPFVIFHIKKHGNESKSRSINSIVAKAINLLHH